MKKEETVAYFPATTVLSELHRMLSEVSLVGVSSEHTTIGGSFEEWSSRLVEGQTAWIYSLEQFRSITELMVYHDLMSARGVTIRSISERWFNDPSVSGREVLSHLFRLGESIHRKNQRVPLSVGPRLQSGVSATMVEKIKQAIALRATRQLSVVAACRVAGCGVNAYYRYLKQQQ